MPLISIITCSADDARFRAVSENYARALAGEDYEIIRVQEVKSLSEGYNRGIRQSKGRFVILCHDDIEILNADFSQRLLGHLEKFDLIGVAGTKRVVCGSWAAAGPPYCYGQVAQRSGSPGRIAVNIFSAPTRVIDGIQSLDGLFLACRRKVVETVQFDEVNFDGFHCYDADFTFRAYLAGFRLAVCCDINIFHASLGNPDQNWHKYMANFTRKFHDRLFPMQLRPFFFSEAAVLTREEVVEAMNPPHWPAQ